MSPEPSDPIELKDHSQAASRNPKAYEGTVRVEGVIDDVPVQRAAELVKCGELLDRHGRWAITEFGIECLAMYYPIRSDEVHDSDWLEHLSEKSWFSLDDGRDFSAVWKKAKEKWPAP